MTSRPPDPQDPSGLLPAANVGKPPLLKIQNIAARPELNNGFGQAVSFASGRYVVALIDATTAAAMAMGGNNATAQPTVLRLKPENLIRATKLDQLKFGVGVALVAAKMQFNDPAVQEWGNRIISKLPPSLQSNPNVSPEKALLGAAVVMLLALVLLWRLVAQWVGFTKLFMIMSLLAMVVSVSSPDWMEAMKQGKPAKLTVQRAVANFTMRWKDQLIAMTGRANISDRIAKASLLLILVGSAKVILTPSQSQTRIPAAPMSVGMGSNMPHEQKITRPPQNDLQLEQIYKLGFEDAKSEKEFGTSLPEGILSYNALLDEYFRQQQPHQQHQDQYSDDSNYEWAYNPPPTPPKPKSRFGMGTLLSLFALFNFGKDLVTSPDGRLNLDMNYIIMRLRSIETWRLGMLGMSLYRVVQAFFF